MSKYTTEVRFICENKSGLDTSKGSNDVDSIIANSWNKIFTTKVSFFDEEYRSVICQKILKHYYLREIGCETIGIWTLWMNTRLEEIMPYYNQLYKSALIDFNPLHDTDLTRTHKLNVEGSKEENGTRNDVSKEDRTENSKEDTKSNENSETTTTGDATRNLKGNRNTDVTSNETKTTSGSSDSTTRDLYSDTPQGAITGLENENYLTNARKVTDNTTEKGSEQTNGTEKTAVTYGEDETNKTGTNSKTTTNTTGNTTGSITGTTNGTLNSTTNNKGTSNTTEDYIETVIGKQSGITFSKMLIEFRETFLNIDMQVINEFSDLFFGLW